MLVKARLVMKKKPYIFIGDHNKFDGDHPWWTLRFEGPISSTPGIESIIDAVVKEQGGCNLSSSGPDSAHLDFGDAFFESTREWAAFHTAVESAFDAVHEEFPLFAVVFFDWDGMSEASRRQIELYDRLKRARGKKRVELAGEVLRSGNEAMERLGLEFAGSLIGSEALREYAARSDPDLKRARTAVNEAIRKWAFDYDRKQKPLDDALLALDDTLITDGTAYWVARAAVRNAPAMGRSLRRLADANPVAFEEIIRSMQDDPEDTSIQITLAFVEAERGNVDQARKHTDAAMERLGAGDTKLWKVTIPGWLQDLKRKLG